MSSTHYYDRHQGEVIKRLPQNPDKIAGSNAGRKQRNKDQAREVYPRAGLPISRVDRSDYWINAYQQAYYQPKATGRPMLGNVPVVTISVSCDRAVVDECDRLGISRSEAFVCGANILLKGLNKE